MIDIVTISDYDANNIAFLLYKVRCFNNTLNFNDCKQAEYYYNLLAKKIKESWEKEKLNSENNHTE